MPKKIFIPSELGHAIARCRSGGVITVRSLLQYFGGEKRSPTINSKIKKAFKKLKIMTSPDYRAVSLDETITFVKTKLKIDTVREQLREPLLTFGMVKCVEDQRKERLVRAVDGILDEKNLQIKYAEWSVRPDDTVDKAIFLLSRPKIDFIPVFNSPRDILGVISWDDFGIKSLLTKNNLLKKCKDIMKKPVLVSETDSLWDFKQEIVSNGYVIVKNDNDVAYAIVRSSDLAEELIARTEGFLLLREIEQLIRNIIEFLNLNQTEFDLCLQSDKRGKNITLYDLEFSQYVGFFGSEIVKKKMERRNVPNSLTQEIQKTIERIRETRNGVVHFHSDENTNETTARLKSTRIFLDKVYKEIVYK